MVTYNVRQAHAARWYRECHSCAILGVPLKVLPSLNCMPFPWFLALFSQQVGGGEVIEIVCGEISLFFFAVGILYLMLVFFAIQVHHEFQV